MRNAIRRAAEFVEARVAERISEKLAALPASTSNNDAASVGGS
jgi:hypothetical protein